MQKHSIHPPVIAIVMFIATVLGCSAMQSFPQATADTSGDSIITPPPLESLGHGARLPTAEELEQEKIFDARQVAQAIEKLNSADVHQRIVATETLNAYQIPAAEQQLSDTLLNDDNAQVRLAAAMSLILFKKLSDRTVNVLLKALHDKDRKTRQESLNALLNYTLRLNADDEKYRQIVKRLRQEIRYRKTYADIRDELKAFFNDRKPVKNVFFSPSANSSAPIHPKAR